MKDKFYIGPVWACNNELCELLKFIDDSKRYVFSGDFLSFGPNLIETINTLTQLKKNNSNIEFLLSNTDRQFLIACSILKETTFEKTKWLNPYSGLFSSIYQYNIDPFQLVNDSAIKKQLHKSIIESKHLEFYHDLNQNFTTPFSLVNSLQNNSLKILSNNGEVIKEIPFKADYILDYKSWLKIKMNNFVFGDDVGSLYYD